MTNNGDDNGDKVPTWTKGKKYMYVCRLRKSSEWCCTSRLSRIHALKRTTNTLAKSHNMTHDNLIVSRLYWIYQRLDNTIKGSVVSANYVRLREISDFLNVGDRIFRKCQYRVNNIVTRTCMRIRFSIYRMRKDEKTGLQLKKRIFDVCWITNYFFP